MINKHLKLEHRVSMRKAGLFFRLFFLIAFLVTCKALIFSQPVLAQSSAAKQHKVVIYLFWGDGCPHCAAAKPFLNELTQRYANAELRAYEVWYVPKNQDIFKKKGTSFLRDWNGNYVLDLDEIPWKATPEELHSLKVIEGKVIAVSESQYNISGPNKLYKDKESVYVLETDVTDLFN